MNTPHIYGKFKCEIHVDNVGYLNPMLLWTSIMKKVDEVKQHSWPSTGKGESEYQKVSSRKERNIAFESEVKVLQLTLSAWESVVE